MSAHPFAARAARARERLEMRHAILLQTALATILWGLIALACLAACAP